MEPASAVTVTAPARPEYVRVLRAVARAVAARLDFTYDRIEDLHLVVDEACASVLAATATSGELRMRLSPGPGEVVIVVRTDADVDPDGWPPPRMEETLAWRVLSGLADEASFENDGGPTIRVAFRGRA